MSAAPLFWCRVASDLCGVSVRSAHSLDWATWPIDLELVVHTVREGGGSTRTGEPWGEGRRPS
jgi:hypothetical protein